MNLARLRITFEHVITVIITTKDYSTDASTLSHPSDKGRNLTPEFV
jgi:hypothetical protein